MAPHIAPRALTLTEELEKLEQQITLTLQEIDSNFSKAHRIVTSSILPVVDEYAKHSSEVWQGSKFWKQFFEASANVSLSGYEEPTDETITTTEPTESFQTPTRDESTVIGGEQHGDGEEDSSVESPSQVTGVHTTPKLPHSTVKGTRDARGRNQSTGSYHSATPRKYTGQDPAAIDSSEQPSTPRTHPADLQSSPFEPESAFQASARSRPHNNDPLMHRAILDRNYRIQATPHTQRKQYRQKPAAITATPATASKKAAWDDSPPSSPDLAAPQLRSELFSPAKVAPRTPGVSVLTPAAKKGSYPGVKTSTGISLFSPRDKTHAATRERTRASHFFADADGDDDDDDDETDDILADMSPPKTMQFHVPQSRLLQTPAREASRKIVDDLLLTAGADATDEIENASAYEGDDLGFELDLDLELDSPSVVGGRGFGEERDDTF